VNYDKARQIDPQADRPDAGKWRYTTSNRRVGTYAIGYCADGCPGHDTPEEAEAHQREYELDRCLRLDGRYVDAQHKCVVCNEWTQGFAHFVPMGAHYDLCDEHRTREQVEKLYSGPGERWHF